MKQKYIHLQPDSYLTRVPNVISLLWLSVEDELQYPRYLAECSLSLKLYTDESIESSSKEIEAQISRNKCYVFFGPINTTDFCFQSLQNFLHWLCLVLWFIYFFSLATLKTNFFGGEFTNDLVYWFVQFQDGIFSQTINILEVDAHCVFNWLWSLG